MKPSKAERKRERVAAQRKQHFKDNLYYRLFIGCIIGFVVFYWLMPLTIGHDIRHSILIVFLPIITGVALAVIYRKKFLDAKAVAAVTNKWRKLCYSIAILSGVALLSYITLGLAVNIAWKSANYYTAKNQKQQTLVLPVDEFHKGGGSRSSSYVSFYFKGNKETIKVSRDFIKPYTIGSPAAHRIKLKIREGLWNHYLVEDWDIIK